MALPPIVAANVAAILNPAFEQLLGIADFYNNGVQCTSPVGLTPAQLDAALPTLDFTFPNVQKGYVFTASYGASSALRALPFTDGSYIYCAFGATSDEANNGGANILPNTLMVRSIPGLCF